MRKLVARLATAAVVAAFAVPALACEGMTKQTTASTQEKVEKKKDAKAEKKVEKEKPAKVASTDKK